VRQPDERRDVVELGSEPQSDAVAVVAAADSRDGGRQRSGDGFEAQRIGVARQLERRAFSRAPQVARGHVAAAHQRRDGCQHVVEVGVHPGDGRP
jgi:hypothetical protein